ncbi:hypothetical protein BGZ63DRAFT_429692 [Mariannaea sp. PMI_226]|nr:hypothetical protein BGZ63DRAFT_429692 [Mariannaea sp. PMI_226]
MDNDAISDREDLVDKVGGEDDKEESFYMSILKNAQNSVNGHHRIESMAFRDAITLDGEKVETKWKHPDKWSLPVREVP